MKHWSHENMNRFHDINYFYFNKIQLKVPLPYNLSFKHVFISTLYNKVFSLLSLQALSHHCKKYDHLLFHTMSVGSYNMTVLRMIAVQESDPADILQRCRGVIYDSIVIGSGKGGIVQVDGQNSKPINATDRMLQGVALSSSKNPFVQHAIKLAGRMYFFITKKHTVTFYDRALTVVREEPLPVPTLIYASKNDVMSDAEVIEKLRDIWVESKHIPVELKLWEVSGHAQHLVKHREEYLSSLEQFMAFVFDKNLPHFSQASKL